MAVKTVCRLQKQVTIAVVDLASVARTPCSSTTPPPPWLVGLATLALWSIVNIDLSLTHISVAALSCTRSDYRLCCTDGSPFHKIEIDMSRCSTFQNSDNYCSFFHNNRNCSSFHNSTRIDLLSIQHRKLFNVPSTWIICFMFALILSVRFVDGTNIDMCFVIVCTNLSNCNAIQMVVSIIFLFEFLVVKFFCN
jgi:hypothetical protein